MLKPIVLYRDRLRALFVEEVYNSNFWAMQAWKDYKLPSDEDDWHNILRVMVDEKDNILAYICADLNIKCNAVNNIAFMAFSKGNRIVYEDCISFLLFLRDYGMINISFSAVLGGDGCRLYRHVMRKRPDLGIKEIGKRTACIKTYDGMYRDNVLFEIVHLNNIPQGKYKEQE